MKVRAIALAATLATTSAQAGQPIHESLVECSVLVDLLIGPESPADGNRMLDFYVRASQAMRDEAERRTDAQYVRAVSAQKNDLWHQRWDNGDWDDLGNRGELEEWVTYCFKLADHLDLDLPR